MTADGVPLSDEEFSRRKRSCSECGSALWQADNSGPRRYPLADYVKNHMPGFFDLLIGDEVHEYKGRGSAQGIAAGVLADACGRSLTLTGTLARRLQLHACSTCSIGSARRFARNSGGRRRDAGSPATASSSTPLGRTTGTSVEDGRNSRSRKYRKVVKERPGLAPSALFHLIGNSVFLRLSDVASGLPDYDEQVMLTAMDSGRRRDGLLTEVGIRQALRESYGMRWSRRLRMVRGDSFPHTYSRCSPTRTAAREARRSSIPPRASMLIQVPPLAEDRVYPKEKALLDLVAAERMAGRRVLVYATHTGTRDITGRMDDMLTRHGFKVAVMKADSVAPERREAWVAEKVKQGVDVIICHPRLVQTGLDLVDFPTIVWYETDYSVYTMRQASRRSWRIGQTRPVKVIFMAYRQHPPSRRAQAGG